MAEQEDAYYNLGNTLYRTGQRTVQSSPQQTLQSWKQAVKAYDTALELRADDADAKYNRDLVKRKIDELKKNPPQNPQNNQSNQNNQQQQQDPQQKPPQNSQPPPKGGTPPPGRQPPGQQPPPQGQPPPGQQPPGQQPPQGQKPPGQQPPGQQPPPGNAGGADQDDSQHAPGQMSREEAQQLLDSQKGDERRALGIPLAQKQPNSPPDKPVKDW